MQLAAVILAGALHMSGGGAPPTEAHPQARPEVQTAIRAEPVSFAQHQAVTRAPFLQPGEPALNLKAEDDKAVDVEVREKDAWFDTDGVRLSATKVGYKRRF